MRYIFLIVFVILYSCKSKQYENERFGIDDDSMVVKQINDSMINVKSYHKNSQLKDDFNIDINHELHGSYKEYSDAGVLLVDWEYYHGKKNGKQFFYHDNGFLASEENYFNGVKTGKQYSFFKGDTSSVDFYEDGRLISSKVSEDFYTPPRIMMEELMSHGLDSVTSLSILRDDKFGFILKTDSGAVFIEGDWDLFSKNNSKDNADLIKLIRPTR